MKAVYSFWSKDSQANGYNTLKDFLVTFSLSMLITKKHFKDVELVTNTDGKRIFIDILDLPFTSVSTGSNRFNHLPKWMWGYAKLGACEYQNEPFVHLDNDVFLWDGLPDKLMKKKMFFQSVETPFKAGYGLYGPLLKFANKCPNFPKIIKNNPVDYAYNCGIMGCNDPSIIKEWFKISTDWVLDKDNHKRIIENKDLLIHQNLLLEQYFIASITKRMKLRPYTEIGLLLGTETILADCYKEGQRFTHLWGCTKKDQGLMNKVYKRLKSEFPIIYSRIISKVDSI